MKHIPDVVGVYKRIRDASESGRGIRLSAKEAWSVWNLDDAVRTAVLTAELEAEQVSKLDAELASVSGGDK